MFNRSAETLIQNLLERLAKCLVRAFPRVLSASSRDDVDDDSDAPEFEVVFAYRRGNSEDTQQLALFIGTDSEEEDALHDTYYYESELHAAFHRLVQDCVAQSADSTQSTLNNILSILEGRSYFANRAYSPAHRIALDDLFGGESRFKPEAYFRYTWTDSIVHISHFLKKDEDQDPEEDQEAEVRPLSRKLEKLEDALCDEIGRPSEREVCGCSETKQSRLKQSGSDWQFTINNNSVRPSRKKSRL